MQARVDMREDQKREKERKVAKANRKQAGAANGSARPMYALNLIEFGFRPSC